MDKKILLDSLRTEYILQRARFRGAANAYETEYVKQFSRLVGAYKGMKFAVNFKNNQVEIGVFESIEYTHYREGAEILVFGRWILKSGKPSKSIQELFSDLDWHNGHVKNFTEGEV